MNNYPRVHVVLNDAGQPTVVWLDTDIQDFDGLCIGAGDDPVQDAVRNLEQALATLQAPPTPKIYRHDPEDRRSQP